MLTRRACTTWERTRWSLAARCVSIGMGRGRWRRRGGGCQCLRGWRRASCFCSSRRRHTRFGCDWSSDVCSSDLSWDELPEDIKNTYDRLGIPEAEKQRLIAGVAAQYESEVVYHKIREDLEEQGVLFLDTDTGLKQHEELFKEYFGTVIPVGDNKFAALNTSVWSGGSFIYVPKGVNVEIPLQAYFRINTENMGQFERTLIIVDEGAYVHYVE